MLATDHKSLTWIKTKKGPNARISRYRLLISEYDYDIVHLPGVFNPADSLSRNPIDLLDKCGAKAKEIMNNNKEKEPALHDIEEISPTHGILKIRINITTRSKTRKNEPSEKYKEAIEAPKTQEK